MEPIAMPRGAATCVLLSFLLVAAAMAALRPDPARVGNPTAGVTPDDEAAADRNQPSPTGDDDSAGNDLPPEPGGIATPLEPSLSSEGPTAEPPTPLARPQAKPNPDRGQPVLPETATPSQGSDEPTASERAAAAPAPATAGSDPLSLSPPGGAFAFADTGETIEGLARRVYGSSWASEAVWQANRDQVTGLTEPLRPGQPIRTPWPLPPSTMRSGLATGVAPGITR